MNADLLSQLPQVSAFVEAGEPMLPAYRHGLLSFVAIVHMGDTVILRARLRLSVESPKSLRSTVNTRNLRAGQVQLDGSPMDLEGLVGAALSGAWLPLSQDPLLKLLPETSCRYGAYYENSAPSYARPLQDPEKLVLSGVGRFELLGPRQKGLDRELNEIALDSLDELMRAYGLRGSDQTTFEVAAESVANIDSTSRLRGTRAEVVVRLARGLELGKFRLTARVANPAADTIPQWVSGTDIRWAEDGGYLMGSWSFEFQGNSVIDCRAVYAGRTQEEVRLQAAEERQRRDQMLRTKPGVATEGRVAECEGQFRLADVGGMNTELRSLTENHQQSRSPQGLGFDPLMNAPW